MPNENTPSVRAKQALQDELSAMKVPISAEVIQNVYDIEEKVQFLSDRGPVPDQIAKIVRIELDKKETG